ncbi:putative GPI-anchored cell surface glycoprotein [Aspergillus homomorphus CBS 101889]|uniref:GPI-anchored cell surface glycoprotein n=1 Tax=Aspergillus homomorphus (strain CBS 101889) TaxID=1450537 RepID=A0A395I1K9_ASPHC|nr:hypothetical protein BO97DRAFT_365506 [Aspergillus homomorphus CBS 101889]RAL13950.1 hypothetical protein BO97DRAFT_365506 [Aspergillus homomorphus CBS 101889]
MSLNGLDHPTVIEAYQTALTEAGGWFLLRYVSRDEVALLERGTGGVPDVRNAIESYEETSPLYGFLQYRRRKVVLSYLPEGMSRLLQARTTVQFQSILDKFSPHDTVFSVSQPSELTESALSSACLLHTASGSITSSCSSLRRRKLMEIAEDAEEQPVDKDTPPALPPMSEMRQRAYSQISEATVVPPSTVSSVQQSPIGPESSVTTLESLPGRDRSPSVATSERAPSIRTFQEDASQAASESRKSSQSTRPSIKELERAVGYVPKVKLGPRPSLDGSGRPRTAGNLSRTADKRPVASLPAGVRSSALRKANPSPSRPRSQGGSSTSASVKVPSVPPLLVPPLSAPVSRPKLSPGAKSLSALSSGASHERERLMKALQMRKTQMAKKAREEKKIEATGGKGAMKPDPTENKENTNYQLPEEPKHHWDKDEPVPVSEPGNKPLSETSGTMPPGKLQKEAGRPAVPSLTKPELAMQEADTVTPDPQKASQPGSEASSDGSQIAATTESCQLSESETHALEEALAASDDGESTGGPCTSSAVFHVPPENDSGKAPKEEIVGPSPPQTADNEPLVPGEQEVQEVNSTSSDSIQALQSKSIPRPDSPSFISRPTPFPDSPSIPVPHSTAPQHDLTPESSNVERQHSTTRKEKRKPYLEPIQVPTPDYSDDENLLSDDSFMEELKSATVEEAKPISVGISPLSPGYSNTSNGNTSPDAWRNSRAVSNPSAIGHQPPEMQALPMGRSVSTSYADAGDSNNPVLVAKKINVSSGISKRIKALEKFSNTRETTSTAGQTLAAPSFETLRKGYSDASTISRPVSFYPESFSRTASLRRPVSQAGPGLTRSASSVSVTARIVRERPATGTEAPSDPSEPGSLNLLASPLTVEHNSIPDFPIPPSLSKEPVVTPPEEPDVPTALESPEQQSAAASDPRPESRSSHTSTLKNEEAIEATSPIDLPSSPEEKKASRTSRLIRRMSSFTSNSRKNVMAALSPMVKEEKTACEDKSETAGEAPQAIDIGEVNVQFPDTLLWKRRFVRIDDKGYLVLTPGNLDSSNRNMVKRYHLTEFRTPCLPDEDRQELPNSILLDFNDGNTLQCACESRNGQSFVLQTLVDAHRTYGQTLAQ